MAWLFAIALRLRGNGWFVANRTGGIIPFPLAWQAWAISGFYVVALALTVLLPAEPGWIARIGGTIAFVGFAWWTLDGRDP
jgi:uncharacterized membrane protein